MTEAELEALDTFARVAAEYCAWAEAAPGEPRAEALIARRLLLDLMRGAIALPEVCPEEVVRAEITIDDYMRVFRRFGALPFQYYSECFDPLLVPAEEPVRADLADDLADVWRDLKEGLMLRDQSPESAAWQWRFNFEIHWGHHASAGLYALQSWFSQHLDDDLDG